MENKTEKVKILNIKIDYCEEIIDDLLELQHNITADINTYKEKIREYKTSLEELGFCQHAYSKAMYQPHPRLCVKCSEPEEEKLQIQSLPTREQQMCEHMYSRSMDQVYPRLCTKCKYPEDIETIKLIGTSTHNPDGSIRKSGGKL